MVISDVLLACDTVECGYRVVELEDGRFAFVWGNIAASAGDELPQGYADEPLAEKGIEVYRTYEEAIAAYRQCAEALRQTSSRAGDEMLAILE